jgi:hypothetical protein
VRQFTSNGDVPFSFETYALELIIAVIGLYRPWRVPGRLWTNAAGLRHLKP